LLKFVAWIEWEAESLESVRRRLLKGHESERGRDADLRTEDIWGIR
jgi:hypothetical protein